MSWIEDAKNLGLEKAYSSDSFEKLEEVLPTRIVEIILDPKQQPIEKVE